MKKLTQLVLVLLIGALQSNAQITVNRSDFGNIGDQLLYGTDTTGTNLSIGPAGANVTWDFSTSAVANFYDTAIFKDPTLIAGSPVEANVGVDDGKLIQYFNIANDKVELVIQFDQFGLDNQTIQITSFPFTFGNVVHDSAYTKTTGTPEDFGFSGLPFDSVRITIDIHTTSAADGWGTLKIATETYPALRVRNITNVDVTVEGKAPIIGWTVVPTNLDRKQELYAWYGNNKKFSLAEAIMDTSENIASFKYQVNSIPTPTGLNKLSGISINNLYPNPANDHVSIDLKSEYKEVVSMQIVDLTGKVVADESFQLNGNVTLAKVNTTSLSDGIYTAHFASAHTNGTAKFIVKH
jgi:hypothetical protein